MYYVRRTDADASNTPCRLPDTISHVLAHALLKSRAMNCNYFRSTDRVPSGLVGDNTVYDIHLNIGLHCYAPP